MAGAIVNPYAVTPGGPPGYEGAVLKQGPVGFWMLNETSGDAIDTGSAGIDGVYTGTGITRASASVFGLTAPRFGSNYQSKVVVPNNSAWAVAGGYSATASWVALVRTYVTTGTQAWMAKYSQNGREWALEVDTATPRWLPSVDRGGTSHGVAELSYTNSPVAYTDYHVALTYNYPAQQFYLYINGTLVASDTNFSNVNTAMSSDIWIGGNEITTGRYWNGAICGVAIFDKVLSQTEITAQYDAAVAGP